MRHPLMYVHPLIPSCYLTPSTLSCTAPHKTLLISPFLSLNIRAKHLEDLHSHGMYCFLLCFCVYIYMSIYMFYITYDLFTTPLDILSHILYFSACTTPAQLFQLHIASPPLQPIPTNYILSPSPLSTPSHRPVHISRQYILFIFQPVSCA